jgi:hypothetical protein
LVALLRGSGRSGPDLLGAGVALGPSLRLLEPVGVGAVSGRSLVWLFRRRLLIGLLWRRSLLGRFGGVLSSGFARSRLRGLSPSGLSALLSGLSASLTRLPALLAGPSVSLTGLPASAIRLPASLT